MSVADLRVCLLGSYDPDYARHYVIRTGLARAGVEVIERPLPRRAHTLGRVRHMLAQFPRREECDLVLIPAFNQLLAPFAWLRGRLGGVPVAADYMVGLTDALADRQRMPVTPAQTGKARAYRTVDRVNTARMLTLTDTEAHRLMFGQTIGARLDRMAVLPVGVNDRLLDAVPAPDPFGQPGPVTVLYIGTFIPFHGVEVIIRAAHLLRDDTRFRFELIGAGQTYAASVQLAEQLGLQRISFVRGYFPWEELLPHVARAGVMLGVFGDTDKTRYVVPNKVYEGMALGRPVVTAESPALDEIVMPGDHLLTVSPGSPEALSAALRALLDDPARYHRQRAAALDRVRAAFLPEHIGARLRHILETHITQGRL